MIKFTPKQVNAFDGIMDFMFNRSNMFYVFSGVAGSGKTSIISRIISDLESLKKNYHVCALTGRAVSVIKSYAAGGTVSTIHSMMYEPIINSLNEIIGYKKVPKNSLSHLDFIIVDEASMVDQKILTDLLSYDIPILFVGDSEQLPPINSDLNIMEHPDIHLDEVHRVAEGNPIIQLSREIREYGEITLQKLQKYIDGNHLKMINNRSFNVNYIKEANHDIVICGTNRKRTMINNMYRSILPNWDISPQEGEKIMCLKNMAYENGFGWKYIYNGELYKITDTDYNEFEEATLYNLESVDSNKTVEATVKPCSWDESCNHVEENIFTYGYAATCYKMQGSQFGNVCYYKENVSGFCDQRRHDYTAITRSKEYLTVVL